ncbi:MAG TPA: SRPBCC domain-containing protein [Chitinophagaceae bacterium]
MRKQQFSATIHAPKEKVWQVLWSEETYPAWTAAFAEGSRAETDGWKQGTTVRFLDGRGSGMISRVAENRPNEFMSFEHLGVIHNGVEDTESEEVKKWKGSKENYYLEERDGNTELKVEMDISEEWKDYFLKTWPRALENIRKLSEK